MTSGTTYHVGLTAGAARPGPCPVEAVRGTTAPAFTRTWHPQSAMKQVNVAFATYLTPRPLERSP